MFGEGAGHAFGSDALRYRFPDLPDGLRTPPGFRAVVESAAQRLMEHAFLLGPADETGMPAEFHEARAAMTQDVEYAHGETELAARLVEHGYAKKEKLDRAIVANELGDILRTVVEALVRGGIDPDRFIDTLGRDGLTAFVRDLPTRAVTMDLRRDKHAQAQQRWEPNDLNDVVGLPSPRSTSM